MSILRLPFKSLQRRLFVAFKAGLGTVINVDEWLIAMNEPYVGRQGRFFVDVKFPTIFNIFKHHNKLMHM
jgi:hypothetical protein